MEASLAYLDLPSFLFMRRAFLTGDMSHASRLSARLLANRESSELQAQDRQMARALRRVLLRLAPQSFSTDWMPSTYAEALAHATVAYELAQEAAQMVFCYGWVEQHTSALCRLIPLGPLAGQTLLDSCLRRLPTVMAKAATVTEEEIGASCPGMALASALHETQYTRLFRS
jgi:urease accessory protein